MGIAARIQVATTATVILAGGIQRRGVVLYNNGPNTIWVDDNSSVTAANGFPVPPGASLTIDRSAVPVLYGICPSALQVTPADTCVLAES